MGLERRGNNLYYYRKERNGSRVVSVYAGKGSFAQLMSQFEELRKEEESIKREANRERLATDLAQQAEIDDQIDGLCADASAYVDALFLANGYHQHSRTWRRKSNG